MSQPVLSVLPEPSSYFFLSKRFQLKSRALEEDDPWVRSSAGPLLASKNKGGIPESYSPGLLFSVLHCEIFFLDAIWDLSVRGWPWDICLPLSGALGPFTLDLGKGNLNCVFLSMGNKAMYILRSFWFCIYPCNWPRKRFQTAQHS